MTDERMGCGIGFGNDWVWILIIIAIIIIFCPGIFGGFCGGYGRNE